MILKTTDLQKFYEIVKTTFTSIKEMPLGSNFGYLLEPLLNGLNKYIENCNYSLDDMPIWDALNELYGEIKGLYDTIRNWR